MSIDPAASPRFEPGAITDFSQEIDWIALHVDCGQLTEAAADELTAQAQARLLGRRLFKPKTVV